MPVRPSSEEKKKSAVLFGFFSNAPLFFKLLFRHAVYEIIKRRAALFEVKQRPHLVRVVVYGHWDQADTHPGVTITVMTQCNVATPPPM